MCNCAMCMDQMIISCRKDTCLRCIEVSTHIQHFQGNTIYCFSLIHHFYKRVHVSCSINTRFSSRDFFSANFPSMFDRSTISKHYPIFPNRSSPSYASWGIIYSQTYYLNFPSHLRAPTIVQPICIASSNVTCARNLPYILIIVFSL